MSAPLRQDLYGLEKGAQELTDTKEAVKMGRKKKAVIEKKRTETKLKLKKSSEKLKELNRERDNTKRELEEKEEELALLLLQEQLQSSDVSYQSVIADKKAEIQELEHEVTRVEWELSQARDAQVTTMTKHVEELSEQRDQMKTDLDKKEKELHLFRLQEQSEKQCKMEGHH